MAYSVQPARPRRPVSVVVGVAMLLIATAALVILAVSQFLIVSPVGREIERVTDDPQQEGVGTVFAGVLFGGGGALNAVCAVVLAVLAGFDLAGKRPARIMTWIVAPLAALCCGCASAIYNKYLFGMSGGSASAGQELTAEQTPGNRRRDAGLVHARRVGGRGDAVGGCARGRHRVGRSQRERLLPQAGADVDARLWPAAGLPTAVLPTSSPTRRSPTRRSPTHHSGHRRGRPPAPPQ